MAHGTLKADNATFIYPGIAQLEANEAAQKTAWARAV
jgi:hypothetical protein